MEKKTPIVVPVLVIGFNRPDILRQCIAKLRESKPQNMYFACDGARADKEGEDAVIREVRSVMENDIDWPCEKHYRYNERNKGCEVTESEAISWVLSENEYIIVVEDDIIAPYSFLKFAQEMLYLYKDAENVYMISSNNQTPMPLPNNEDYCFSNYGHIWGWATWRRAWNHFNLYVNDFDNTVARLNERTDLTKLEKKSLCRLCNYLKHNVLMGGTWDYVWSYIKSRDGGLSIVPRVHLSSNVGVVGLHAKGQSKSHYRKYDEEFVAKVHPKEIKRNLKYDEYHYRKHIKSPNIFVRQILRVRNFVKGYFLQS